MGKRGGGKSRGKKIGKVVGIGLAAWGIADPALFGLKGVSGAAWKAAMYGLSLGSTIGSVFDKPKSLGTNATGLFDAKMNKVDPNSIVPIIYGTQKCGGMQTYHRSSKDQKTLWKHVLLAEGEISNITGVTANGYLCKYSIGNGGKINNPPVFGLTNKVHSDAKVSIVNAKTGLSRARRFGDGKRGSSGITLQEEKALNATKPKEEDFLYYRGNRGRRIMYTGEALTRARARYEQAMIAWNNKHSEVLSKRMAYEQEMNRVGGWITDNDKMLVLYAGGQYDFVLLQHSVDIRDDKQNDYATSFSGVYQYILGDSYTNLIREHGWELVKPVVCSDPPERLNYMSDVPAYNTVAQCSLSDNLPTKDSYVNCYLGKDGETPSNYMVTGGYPKVAYLNATLKWCEEIGSGNPTITSIIDGRKVYDPRIQQTVFSKNPALILMDYLTNDVFGAGEYISMDMLDIDSFIDVANYCDETVDYVDPNGNLVKEPRYELNLTINERRSHLDIVKDILKCFAAFIVFSNDKIALRCERGQNPVYHFDKNNIVEKSVSYKGNSVDQSPNRFLITYVEPALDYTGVKVIVEDTVSQMPSPIGRGRAIEQEIELAGVARQSQALRLGKIYRDIIRLCPVTITFKTGLMAMHLEPGDVVTVSRTFIDPLGAEQLLLDKVPVRIQEIREEKGTYEITARQYNPSIYDDTFGANLKPIDSLAYKPPISLTPPDVKATPYIHTDVRFVQSTTGQGRYDLVVQWESSGQYYSKGELWYRKKGDTDWTLIGTHESSLTVYNVELNTEYELKVVTVDTTGTVNSNVFNTTSIVVKRSVNTPNNPTGLTLTVTDKAVATWNLVSNTEIMYYEVRLDNHVGEESNNLLGRSLSNSIELNTIGNRRSGTLWIFARNVLGEYSTGAFVKYDYPSPNKPTVLSTQDLAGGVSIKLGNYSDKYLTTNMYVGEAKYTFKSDTYQWFSVADIYNDVKFSYTDVFGEGEKSDGSTIVIKPHIPKEWLDAESLGLDDIDKAIDRLDSQVTNLDGSINSRIDTATSSIKSDLDSTKGKVSNLQKQYDTTATWAQQAHQRINKALDRVNSIDSKIATAKSEVLDQANNHADNSIRNLSDDMAALNRTVDSRIATAKGEVLKTANNYVDTQVRGINSNVNSRLTQFNDEITSTVNNATSGITSRVTQLEHTVNTSIVDDIRGLSTSVNTSINGIQSTVTAQGKQIGAVQSSVTQLTNSIDSKVANSTKGLSSRITQLEDGIQATVTNLKSNVSTQIAQLDSAIGTKVANATSGLSSKVTQLENSVNTTITNKLQGLETKVNTTVNGIQSTVAEYKKANDSTLDYARAVMAMSRSPQLMADPTFINGMELEPFRRTSLGQKVTLERTNQNPSGDPNTGGKNVRVGTNGVQTPIGYGGFIIRPNNRVFVGELGETYLIRIRAKVRANTTINFETADIGGGSSGWITDNVGAETEWKEYIGYIKYGGAWTNNGNREIGFIYFKHNTGYQYPKGSWIAWIASIEMYKVDTYDNSIATVKSSITQLSNSIDMKVANATNGLSTRITQLDNAIKSQVIDGGKVMSALTLYNGGARIDGKLLHVTGKSLFDDNIVTNKMIQANAVTADKLSVGSLSAISATIGTLRTKTSGARVEIKDNLIEVFDDNNRLRVRMGVW